MNSTYVIVRQRCKSQFHNLHFICTFICTSFALLNFALTLQKHSGLERPSLLRQKTFLLYAQAYGTGICTQSCPSLFCKLFNTTFIQDSPARESCRPPLLSLSLRAWLSLAGAALLFLWLAPAFGFLFRSFSSSHLCLSLSCALCPALFPFLPSLWPLAVPSATEVLLAVPGILHCLSCHALLCLHILFISDVATIFPLQI